MKATSKQQTKNKSDREDDLPDDDRDEGSVDDTGARRGEETLQEFFAKFEDIYSISIWVLDEATGRWKFKATASHDVVTEEYLQKRFRGGHYKLQLRSQKGLLGTKTQIQIDDPVEDHPAAAATSSAGTVPSMGLFEMMQIQSQRQHELTLAMINRDRPAPAGMNLAEIIPLFKLLQGNGLADQLEALKSLKELTGDSDGGDIMKDLRQVLLPILATKLAGRMDGRGKQQQQIGEGEMDQEQLAAIASAIDKLKLAAQAGADPVVMAKLAIMYAQSEPEQLDFLADLAEQSFASALNYVRQFAPELGREPLAHWMGIFHEALGNELHGAPNSQRHGGNQGDVARDGQTRQAGAARADHAGSGNPAGQPG